MNTPTTLNNADIFNNMKNNKHSDSLLTGRKCWCGGCLTDSVHPLYGLCEECGTFVLKELLTEDRLKEFYTVDGYWRNHVVQVSKHPPIEQRAVSDFNDRIPVWYQVATKHKQYPETVLEIGCSHGGFLHYCREHGVKNIVGVEVDEATCAFARKRFSLPYVCSGLFPNVALPFETFDIITGFDVIEHFVAPVDALRVVSNTLKDNGIFVFQTPCYRGEGKEWEQFRPEEHLFLFTQHNIRRLCEEAGLEIIEILPGYFRDDMFVIGQKKQPINKIIFVRTDAIGDNILASSMLPHIYDRYNKGEITVVCQERVAEVYEASPFVSSVIGFDRKKALSDKDYRESLVNTMKEVHADIVINSVYSREPLTDVLSIECNATRSVAFSGDLCNMTEELRKTHNIFYTTLVKSEEGHRPEIERHRDFLKKIGIDVPALEPSIWITPEDDQFAEMFFKDNNLETSKTIALFAGAQYDIRLYYHYGAAISRLCKEYGLSVIALGSSNDTLINKQNLDATGVPTFNLSDKTTLRQAAALLHRCRLSIGAETGLAHIACAVGTPNVVLLGGGHFGRFMPYSPLTSIACLPLECYGCNWQCRFTRPHCITDVAPEVLTEAVRHTLEGRSDKPRIFIEGDSLLEKQTGNPEWRLPVKNLDLRSVDVITVENTYTIKNEKVLKNGSVH